MNLGSQNEVKTMSLKSEIEIENQRVQLEGIATVISCLTESVTILQKLYPHSMTHNSSFIKTNVSVNTQPDSYLMKSNLISLRKKRYNIQDV